MNTESRHGVDEQPAGREDEPLQRAGTVLSTIADLPINILIVDDEPKNLTVLETVLDAPGYRLVRADSADQALLALVSEEFALLILDIRMPGMTGFELAQTIKGRKKTAGIPIIFLTAYYNEDEHVLEGYGSGAVDYLHKPVNATVRRNRGRESILAGRGDGASPRRGTTAALQRKSRSPRDRTHARARKRRGGTARSRPPQGRIHCHPRARIA